MFIQKPIYRADDFKLIYESYHNRYSNDFNDHFFENLCKNENATNIIAECFTLLDKNNKQFLHKFKTFLSNPIATYFIITNINIFAQHDDLIINGICLNPNANIIYEKCLYKLGKYKKYFNKNNNKTCKLNINDFNEQSFSEMSFSEKKEIIESLCKSNDPKAIRFVKNNINYLIGEKCITNLMENPLPEAVELTFYLIKISIIHKDILLQHPSYIEALCKNSNPKMLEFIKENNIINKNKPYITNYLATNKAAIHLIFNLDYEAMKATYKPFCNELCRRVFHPNRISNFSKNIGMSELEYIDYLC
jgi:hypothetical protein